MYNLSQTKTAAKTRNNLYYQKNKDKIKARKAILKKEREQKRAAAKKPSTKS